MCESHVNDAVRKAADVKKVRSSRVSGLSEIICDDNTDVDKIVSTIKNDGYDVKEVKVSDFEKHGLFFEILICSSSDLFYIKNTRPKRRVFFCSALNTQKKG